LRDYPLSASINEYCIGVQDTRKNVKNYYTIAMLMLDLKRLIIGMNRTED